MTDDDDELLPFPPSVRFACWIWIGFGTIGLVTFVTAMILESLLTGHSTSNFFCGFAISAIFVYLGVSLLLGKMQDPLAGSYYSFVMSIFYFVIVIVSAVSWVNREDNKSLYFMIVGIAFAVPMLSAGVLARRGLYDYIEWRKVYGRRYHRGQVTRNPTDDDNPFANLE